MRLLVVIAVMGTAIAYYFMSGPSTTVPTDGDYLYEVKEGPAVARYKADHEIRGEVYMAIGGGRQDGGMLGEATLAGVAQQTAARLQSRYPDIGKCKSPHSDKLMNQSRTFVLFSRNDAPVENALAVLDEHSRRLRSDRNLKRPCFRISGTAMKENLEARDPSMGPVDISYDGDYVHIDLDHVEMVECRL